MAIKTVIGGIELNPNVAVTVVPVGRMNDLVVPGMAFEIRDEGDGTYDFLDARVNVLRPVHGDIQRAFHHPKTQWVAVVDDNGEAVIDPRTGEPKKELKVVGRGSLTAKGQNAEKQLRSYVEGPILDYPPLGGLLPPFVLYSPDQLTGKPFGDFDAHMGGEFRLYEFDDNAKFMILDGESRHRAIELALDPSSKLPGSKREKLRQTQVALLIIHGIGVREAGQIFADLNIQGVKLTANEGAALNARDPWVRCTLDILERLRESGYDLRLQTEGRQTTAAAQAQGEYLLFSQTVVMVRAIGTGSYSKATGRGEFPEALAGHKYQQVVNGGARFFKNLLDFFAELVPEGVDPARMFIDPAFVFRAMPIKVALGVMGHAWVDPANMAQQSEYRDELRKILWSVDRRWDKIAGKVAPKQKTVTEKLASGRKRKHKVNVEPEVLVLAAAGAKEVGANAVNALVNPRSNAYKQVRRANGGDPDALADDPLPELAG